MLKIFAIVLFHGGNSGRENPPGKMKLFANRTGWFRTSPYLLVAPPPLFARPALCKGLHHLHYLHCFLIVQEGELIANGYRLLRYGISDRALPTIIAHMFCFGKSFRRLDCPALLSLVCGCQPSKSSANINNKKTRSQTTAADSGPVSLPFSPISFEP